MFCENDCVSCQLLCLYIFHRQGGDFMFSILIIYVGKELYLFQWKMLYCQLLCLNIFPDLWISKTTWRCRESRIHMQRNFSMKSMMPSVSHSHTLSSLPGYRPGVGASSSMITTLVAGIYSCHVPLQNHWSMCHNKLITEFHVTEIPTGWP